MNDSGVPTTCTQYSLCAMFLMCLAAETRTAPRGQRREVPAETDGTASEHAMVAYTTTLAKGIVTVKLTARAKPLDVSQFRDMRVL